MQLYSFSLWAERIRKCLKFAWRFCWGHHSLPRFKNPNLMAFAQIPFFLTLSEYPSLSRLFLTQVLQAMFFSLSFCPFQFAFLSSTHPQSPFSRPQLHFSLNIHFHGFNYQFSVVNFQISLLVLTLTESSLCHVLKRNSGSMVLCPGESTGRKWEEWVGLIPPLLPLNWVTYDKSVFAGTQILH